MLVYMHLVDCAPLSKTKLSFFLDQDYLKLDDPNVIGYCCLQLDYTLSTFSGNVLKVVLESSFLSELQAKLRQNPFNSS